MSAIPAVSVVVPTFHRPDLVTDAVRSALAQTWRDLEVVVIVDGRDDATRRVLDDVDDTRVRVHVPSRHLGNADARNAGVALARAPWVAFLDDDDTWMPEKLEHQLAHVQAAGRERVIVSCRLLARTQVGEMVWPRRLPEDGEDLSEYFFCRRTPFTGEGMVVMSAILTSRALLAEVPFTSGLQRHVDPDWLLRARKDGEARLEFLAEPKPFVVWNIESDRARITTTPDWVASLAWCRTNRRLFTDRGYAAFVLHVVGSNAAAQHAWTAFGPLLREARTRGRPAPVDLASHVANFVLPGELQRRVALWYARQVARA